MPAHIITTDDLMEFKLDLLEEFKKLLSENVPSPQSKKYLKSAEVMELLQISSGTLQHMRINGTLPYSKIGGVIIYELADIEALLAQNKNHN